MASEENDFGAFVIGFVIGGLVGAATALLLAPQSGEETRTIILDKSTEVTTKATESATKAMQDARMRAEDFAATAKERAQSLQKREKEQPVVLEQTVAEVEETASE
jgi:gas vesicle protein